MSRPTTTIHLQGIPHALQFDCGARFRFGQHGGNLNALLTVPGQDYYQTVLLIWAALGANSRQLYPTADLLVAHIPYEIDPASPKAIDWPEEVAEHIIEPAFEGASAAGWFQVS